MVEYPEWFLKNPFRPIAETEGVESEDALYLAVGKIAHHWEHLEGALYYLYTRLFMLAHPQGSNLGAYAASYGAIISSSGRRDLVEAIVKVSFHPDEPVYTSLMALLAKVGRAVGRRNDAVHGLVVRYNRVSLYVMPPMYAPIPIWLKPGQDSFKYKYDVKCLEQIRDVLITLRSEVFELSDTLKLPLTFGDKPTPPIDLMGTQKGPQGEQQ